MPENKYKLLLLSYYFIVISVIIYLTQNSTPTSHLITYAVLTIIVAIAIYHFSEGSTTSYIAVVLINAISQGLIISATRNFLDIEMSVLSLINIAGIGIILMVLLLWISSPSNALRGPDMIIALNIILIIGLLITYFVTKDVSIIIYSMILVIVNFNSTVFLAVYDTPNQYMRYLAKRSFGIYIIIIPIMIVVAFFTSDGDGDIGDIIGDISKNNHTYSDGFTDGVIASDIMNDRIRKNKDKRSWSI